MSLSKQEFTNAGRSMLGRAQNGETLTITQIVVGDGSATQPSDLWPLTVLIDTKLDVTISTKNDYGNGTMLVEGSFTSAAAAAAFYLREVGIMAHIGAEADRLYSVANVFADPPDYIDPAAPTVEAFKIKLVIDRIPTANLIVQIGASENVIGSNIGPDTVGPGWYHDAAGNVLNFKRIVQGTSMDIHDSADGNSVYVGIKQLQNNLDLYVPMTYPNPPTGALLFPTVQAAHDYLLTFVIPPAFQATIHVGPNVLTTPNTITFSHPNSSQINLRGQPRVDKGLQSIVASGTPNGTTKEATPSAGVITSDLFVGQSVYLYNTVTNWIGGCRITQLRPNDITLSHIRSDNRPVNVLSETGGTMRLSYFPSQLVNSNATPNTQAPVLQCPYGCGTVENICFEGIGYVLTSKSGTLKNCQLIGGVGGTDATQGLRGLNHYEGTFALVGENVVTNFSFGIVSAGTLAGFDQTVINGCLNGVIPSGAGTVIGSIAAGQPNTVVYLAHCGVGVASGSGEFFWGGSIFCCENTVGLQATIHSTLNINTGPYPSVFQNNGTDIYCQGLSYCNYSKSGGAVPAICNPVLGAPDGNGNQTGTGNQGAIIFVTA
jgi:hypothetical protein